MVKILLEREEVNPDKPGNDGQTPLRPVTKNHLEGVAAPLQSRKAVVLVRFKTSESPPRRTGCHPFPFGACYSCWAPLVIALWKNRSKSFNSHTGNAQIQVKRREIQKPTAPYSSICQWNGGVRESWMDSFFLYFLPCFPTWYQTNWVWNYCHVIVC